MVSFVGHSPPADPAEWTFEGNTTRPSFDMKLDANVPIGSTVWLTTSRFNRRACRGPAAAPTTPWLPGVDARQASRRTFMPPSADPADLALLLGAWGACPAAAAAYVLEMLSRS